MKWLDAENIGIALFEKFPATDPLTIRFTDLRDKVMALDGFDDERHVGWQADLEPGSNLLSLPVVARTAGKGRLVAVIEHEGRTQQVAVDLTVAEPKESRS